MTGRGRGRRPGEGQLSLLLLEQELLDDRDLAVLSFARDHHLQARVADRVRQVLGIDQTRYYQLLVGLLDRPAAAAAEPELIASLRALRDSRQLAAPAGAASPPAVSVVGWVAAADGLVALYLAAHTVLHRPRNTPHVAAVAVALVVVGIALGWLALRVQPPPGPAPVEQPTVIRALEVAAVLAKY